MKVGVFNFYRNKDTLFDLENNRKADYTAILEIIIFNRPKGQPIKL